MARQGGATARRSKTRTCGGVEMICLAEDTQGRERRRHGNAGLSKGKALGGEVQQWKRLEQC